MKIFKKIIKILFFSAIIIFVGLNLFVYGYRDKIKELLVGELNNKVGTNFKSENVELSPFKSFPYISVELKDVYIKNPKEFSYTKSDTLLFSKKIFIKASIIKFINKDISIAEVEAENAIFNFYINQKGISNISKVFKSDTNSSDKKNDFSLEKVVIKNLNFKFSNILTRSDIKSNISSFDIKLTSKNNNLYLKPKVSCRIDKLKFNAVDYLNKSVVIESESELFKIGNEFIIQDGKLNSKNLKFAINGKIINNKTTQLDILLKGEKIGIKDLVQLLPQENVKKLKELKSSGYIDIVLKLTGKAGNGFTPHIISEFGINQGKIKYGNTDISDISFNGFFSNGKRDHPSTSLIHLKDLAFKIGSSPVKGEVKVFNFRYPKIDSHLSGLLQSADINSLFDSINFNSGSLDFDANISGVLNELNKPKLENFVDRVISININSENFGIDFPYKEISVEKINSKISLNNEKLKVDSLFLIYKNSDLFIKGYSDNFLKYINNKKNGLTLNAKVKSKKIDLNTLIPKNTDTTSNEFELPKNILANLYFNIDTLLYNKIDAYNLNGIAQISYNKILIDNFTSDVFNGKLKGTFSLSKNVNIIIKSDLKLVKTDIEDIFLTFDNFNQQTLKSENIKGTLSGKVYFGAAFNNKFEVYTPTIISQADILIENGRLINFEPMLSMSKFIEVSELKDIKFESLYNTVSIRNEQISIPEMEISSSALYIKGSGSHNFNGDYEYHISVLLSDILSKKAKNKRENSEFGVIADDGVRTMLPLKIVSEDGKTKTGYDGKKARENVKEDLKEEKQEIKDIFKEEFGKKDKDSIKNNSENNIIFEFEDENVNTDKKDQQENTMKFEWE